MDEFTGQPHPLSAFKVTIGSSSLRGYGLRLAHASATTAAEQIWVREEAVSLLQSGDPQDVNCAASVLTELPDEITRVVDANLLAGHQQLIVRQASALLCLREPEQYREALLRLAADPDFRVRRTLARAVARRAQPTPPPIAVVEVLTQDPRHSIRSTVSA